MARFKNQLENFEQILLRAESSLKALKFSTLILYEFQANTFTQLNSYDCSSFGVNLRALCVNVRIMGGCIYSNFPLFSHTLPY